MNDRLPGRLTNRIITVTDNTEKTRHDYYQERDEIYAKHQAQADEQTNDNDVQIMPEIDVNQPNTERGPLA